MQSFLPTIVLRHKKENLQKCSLRGLEQRKDFCFLTYPKTVLPENLASYVVLTMGEAPPLSIQDAESGLFIIDATWRYAEKMFGFLKKSNIAFKERSLPPNFRTAYPRRQDDCPNPECGLASIEAIYLAYLILGRNPEGLLDHYYWKEDFLRKNESELSKILH